MRVFSDYQLRHFRGLQGLLLHKSDTMSSDDIMNMQVGIERWIAKQMTIAVVTAFQGLNVNHSVIMCVLSGPQVKQFRDLQAEAFLIARDSSFDLWKRKQFAIEEWVEEQIDKEVLKWTQPYIKVSGN